jgi:mRNA-degrading endonuclease toxin of MazEF toxin-antitoxin module
MSPEIGEIWWADLGMKAKVRPALVLFYPSDDYARSMVILAPLTSEIRGLKGEVDIGKPPWLPKPSAVNIQALVSYDKNALERRMGRRSASHMEAVRAALQEMLGL